MYCEPVSPGTSFTSPAARACVSGCSLGSPPLGHRGNAVGVCTATLLALLVRLGPIWPPLSEKGKLSGHSYVDGFVAWRGAGGGYRRL